MNVRSALWIVLFCGISLVVLGLWYTWYFAMDPIEPFQVNTAELSTKVLMATLGSDFKDAVTAAIADHLRDRPSKRDRAVDVDVRKPASTRLGHPIRARRRDQRGLEEIAGPVPRRRAHLAPGRDSEARIGITPDASARRRRDPLRAQTPSCCG